ncbi:3-phosphoshikimate 1-carboxyvinyltransferase [Macrococcus hajekii]|uniref:3-phosphoshikimate 1-carboxyvinyltransferase n=1 Tax=Macrococcus hajekii TaxID=198482 RepID=A0A4R6BME9_9STAP|nr:3-phosphoshikimate 1-carboxyvinyltransferase [Macrococcus hajekii]TDM02986.1 3-phosphoshikimate 1-carboxyvinyltransferase [Macrococcus hajekii]GGB05575.1 3-phosphoshikimate 1-carboxyvinyltransferase [Macrococcus hajekii]
MKVKLNGPLRGETSVPGDKSMTHRAIMFSSIATGRSTIKGALLGEDCLSTVKIFRQLGVHIDVSDGQIIIDSPGFHHFTEPTQVLYTGNSGTTTRLLAGLLAGLPFRTVLAGDDSIGKRPMKRIIEPLRQMNASISGSYNDTRTPLIIEPSNLTGIDYNMPVASAQVKSAVLLAGLSADASVTVRESMTSRNHTETMLPMYGVEVEQGDAIVLKPGGINQMKPHNFNVPGDISSAAFLIVAALMTPDSDLTLYNVGVNPTRDGILEVLGNMGADIEITERQMSGEPTATIRVRYTPDLKPAVIEGELVPRLIDEIPVIALLMTQAKGKSMIKDASELKVKETNRIDAVVNELSKIGFNIKATDDGMEIEGGRKRVTDKVSSYGDHRMGMMLAVATLLAGELEIDAFDSINVSFPGFMEQFKYLGVK